MASRFHLLEIPRPKTFLHQMSLRTGAEIITFLHLINKVSGIYGLLALLTGATLSGLQLSMYLYSTFILLTTVYLYSSIRKQEAWGMLVLAHVYALDSVVNALYTAFFGVAWFYVLASGGDAAAPGSGTIGDNAGFTSPKYNVSSVEVVAEPVGGGVKSGQNAVAMGQGTGAPNAAGLGSAVFQGSSIMSITLISGFWALRVYFVFIMLAFARQCLRQHIASNTNAYSTYPANSNSKSGSQLAENPFEEGHEAGYGWKGKIGRLMLSGAPTYWLGAEEDGEWMKSLGGKFRKSIQLEQPLGIGERERRRRSGTGPPAPPRELRQPQLANLEEVR
ncbi:Inositolphosphorylceramide synthase subunit Kei1-domain-containing protein [Lophiotrema nucula]|uniref:Inositolphosphorylceramide synthase subunit Kei1-domain-containing protein n=1 Tax=Lophiotrema nucula TaxID=690887 RepID=A0A6A5ZQD1_9PLEO|nr:Inositolphosphorylceramide synthase subunit Kei1-domain-containing protein [Lophiotrema nucula]